MLRPNIPRCFILSFSALLILACSLADIHTKKEETVSSEIPDCEKHYAKEGGLVSSPIYKTWVRYDQLDFKKGFELAVKTLQSRGHWIISIDRVSGSIVAQMVLGKEDKRTYPATFKIAEEDFSLFVHLNIQGAWGRPAPPDLCSFYDEFGELMKRSSPAQKSQIIAASPQKPQEEKKAFSSPPPSPPSPPPPEPIASPTPSPPPLSPAAPVPNAISVSPPSLPRGTVIWVEVNLRDGPSLQSKIIGKALKGSTLEIYEEKEGWLKVHMENGKDGWMSRRAVSETSKIPSFPSSPTLPGDLLKTPKPARLPGPM